MPLLTAPPFEISVLSERHLQALVSLAGAAAAAHDFGEVLDLAADAARTVLGVDALSVSRWELEQGILRTLIVSEEGIDESLRHPDDETYAIGDFPAAFQLLSHGRPHVNTRDDTDADPAELALLEALGMESSAAVPIVYEGRVWGELYVSTGPGRPRVTASDVAFLQAVAAQLAVALGRAEHFTQVSRAAYEDQLTGLANRRAFEDRLGQAVDAARRDGTPLTLVMGDLNGLKALNDSGGHDAGDRALRAVAEALDRALPAGAVAARVGGDEFCALLPGVDAAGGEVLASAVGDALSALSPPLWVAWGVASLGPAVAGPRDLFRAADAAQYEVKRHGAPERLNGVPRAAVLPAAQLGVLLTQGLDALDAIPRTERLRRMSCVAEVLAAPLQVPRWAVVHRRHGEDEILRLLACDHRLDGVPAVPPAERRRAAALPALRRLMSRPGTGTVAQGATEDERGFLDAFGLVAVLGASAATDDGIDGLLLYADADTRPLATVGPVLRALLSAA